MQRKVALESLLSLTSDSPEATMEMGGTIYRRFLQGHNCSLLLLYGPLGAGKTLFVSSLGKALGIEEKIKSPSFNLLNIYSGERAELYHYDLYRLQSSSELEQLGFLEYWNCRQMAGQRDKRLIQAIEWPEIASGLWPPNIALYQLKIEIDERQERRRYLHLYGQSAC